MPTPAILYTHQPFTGYVRLSSVFILVRACCHDAGTCRALGAADARTAAFNVIKGAVTDFDIASIKTKDTVVYRYVR